VVPTMRSLYILQKGINRHFRCFAPLHAAESRPGPRASATMMLYDGDKLVVFGGYNGQEFLNVGRVLAGLLVAAGSPQTLHARATVAAPFPRLALLLQDLWVLHTLHASTGEYAYSWEEVPRPSPSAGPRWQPRGLAAGGGAELVAGVRAVVLRVYRADKE
jgi:hypothetical protein